jgi:glucarate dehydratase
MSDRSGATQTRRADSKLAISDVRVTPVAVKDPPLLNSIGVHEPYALRAVIEAYAGPELVGLSEAYGDDPSLQRLRRVAPALVGLDPFELHELHRRVATALGQAPEDMPTDMIGPPSASKTLAATFAAFEVACLDLQGQAIGRPVSDLLGGAVRGAVPFSGYLFYKWAVHPGQSPDEFREALTPDGIVAQAGHLVATYGFRSLKLKGGVRPPDEEIAAIRALRDAFPEHPLRLDPNANWSVPTSIRVGTELAGALEYLEDPTEGLAGMAEVARAAPMPLATNMCVTTFEDLPAAIEQGAVQIVLSDHHYWGGLHESVILAGICRTFGLGLSMHSNTHLGISLAAMTHLAATIPNLSYACDTHIPWQVEDVIEPGVLRFLEGSVPVPTSPGLGVTLDRDALARLHELYLTCGLRYRDDVGYMRSIDPSWAGTRPRF